MEELIDLVLTTNSSDSIVSEWRVAIEHSLSDIGRILFEVNQGTQRNLRETDWSSFTTEIEHDKIARTTDSGSVPAPIPALWRICRNLSRF